MENYTDLINRAFNAYYKGDYALSLSLYYKILSEDLNNSVNYYNVALVYEAMNEFELAISYYKKSIKLNDKNVRSINNLARIYIENVKDYDVAEVYLNNAIKAAPNDAEAYNLYGNLSMLKDDYDLAVAYLKKSIHFDKDYFKNYYDIAVAYYGLNNTEEAVKNVNKSIELNPDFEYSHKLLQQIS